MGGLYNLVFGENEWSDMILATLKLTRQETGRYRDVWVEPERVVVYTRNGGGNREHYMPDFNGHPNFIGDKDDDYDNTYAEIYFSFPEEHKSFLTTLIEEGRPSMKERWMKAIDDLKS
jgi:hypothetical protein